MEDFFEEFFDIKLEDPEKITEQVYAAIHSVVEKSGFSILREENQGLEAFTQVKKNEEVLDIGFFNLETDDDVKQTVEDAETHKELKESPNLGLKEELRVILTKLLEKLGFKLHAYAVIPLDTPEQLAINNAFYKPPLSLWSLLITDEDFLFDEWC